MVASKPVRMALTPMMVPVPMITPSTVRKARSLWVRMVCRARVMPLRKAIRVMGYRSTRRASIGSSLAAWVAG